MLSSRVFLTLASTGLLLVVPGVLAGSLVDEVAEQGSAIGSPQSLYELALAEVTERRQETEQDLEEQGVDSDASDERRDASRSFRAAQAEIRILLDDLGLDALTDDLQRRVNEADPDALIASDPLGLGQGSSDPEEQSEIQTSATASGWDLPTKPLMVLASTAAAAGIIFWIVGSSGTLGGAAAGGTGTAMANQAAARKFLPYASPLFTRFEKGTVLDHPKREAIYGMIVMKPGITLQDLCEENGLSRTAVSHHLRLMEQQHLVVSKRVGRSRHFFENGGRYGRDQKDAYAVLHNDRSKEVHGYIETNPGAIQKDLCSALGIQASVAHWHVKRLVEANLIEAIRQGRTVSYFPAQSIQPMLTA